MNCSMVIAILSIIALSVVEGILIDRMIEYRKRYRILLYQDERGKPNEIIVCMNAIVVFDGREASWYDKDKSIRWEKR